MSERDLRPIRTAIEGSSIWEELKEDEFRRHLVKLEQQTNAVPIDVQVFDISEGINDEHALPLKIEQRLADDFAFLAAVQEGAQSVAAVCVEQHFSPTQQLKLRIAAMDTFDEKLKTTLNDVCKVLKDATTIDDSVSQLFELIVSQHQTRILARLRSKKWIKPRYLSESHKKPLCQDFTNLIHRIGHIYPSKRDKLKRHEIETDLSDLASIYEDFEECRSEDLLRATTDLIQKTYELCQKPHIRDFAGRIQTAGQTAQVGAAVKTLHQLEKIGAYLRIARDLMSAAKGYPGWFGNITLDYLTPYASAPTDIAYESWAKTCHVHAEVQLTVHYDLLSQDTVLGKGDEKVIWPRTIGTSKYLCYLCYLFIKHHGRFFATNTHGRLYDQWTVPDLVEYTDKLREVYGKVLERMDQEVQTISHAHGPTKQWRAEPMTSRQNLLDTR